MLLQSEAGLQEWYENLERKGEAIWSDLARPEKLKSYVDNTMYNISKAQVDRNRLSMYQKKTENDMAKKTTAHRRLKKNRAPSQGGPKSKRRR